MDDKMSSPSNELKRQLSINKMGAKNFNNNKKNSHSNTNQLIYDKLMPSSSNNHIMMQQSPEQQRMIRNNNTANKLQVALPVITIDSKKKKIKHNNRLMANVKSLIKVIHRFKSK
ncbi:hypothetical protein BLA29_013784 [Euroglyphus maynei]|uniref:Uncharacterized protein n=1 Tax=Euroglyphus maynei TaxID=6958 RepID=A0A1Y3BJ44_EURMA|nr:hypothetical protein BLA29_013784 [Euroglyphus maynei]